MEGFRSCFWYSGGCFVIWPLFLPLHISRKTGNPAGSGREGDRAVVYVQCDDPHQAAIQHRQTEDRLYDIVAEGAGMAEREKASFFYEWVYSKVEYDTELKRKTFTRL